MSAIECKAAVAWSADLLSVETVTVAPPKSGEVRVKMAFTSPCHTDIIALKGLSFGEHGPWFPIILGHEGVGVVECVGDDVSSLAVGDTVVPTVIPNCRQCALCKKSKGNLCITEGLGQPDTMMPDMTSRITCKEQELHVFGYAGTWSEYIVCPEYSLCKINPKTPLSIASLFGCAFSTGFGTVVNAAEVPAGSVCAVWGLGGVGLSAIIGLRSCGAERIFAIDINPAKFEVAKKLGATDCINPTICSEDVATFITKQTGGFGCDYTFEFIGKEETMQQAIVASNPSYGETYLIGVLPGGKKLSIDPMWLLPGRTIRSTRLGGYRMRDAVPKLADDYLAGKLQGIELLISHNLKFEEISEAIRLLLEGGLRISLSFSSN